MHTSKNHAENIVSSLMRFTRYAGRGRYCILAFLAATALASSSLSAAPVTVPGDLAPGFSYRLAFITSTATDATSTDINYYNTFVSNVAGGVPQLAALGTTWKAIGSTASIDARDNTGTNPASTGVPIYTLAGVRIANNNADLWDGTIQSPLNVWEDGTAAPAIAWTGSVASGTVFAGFALGTVSGVRGGNDGFTDSNWIDYGWQDVTTDYGLYAMSDVLVAPEPATMSLLAIGGLALLRRRRKR